MHLSFRNFQPHFISGKDDSGHISASLWVWEVKAHKKPNYDYITLYHDQKVGRSLEKQKQIRREHVQQKRKDLNRIINVVKLIAKLDILLWGKMIVTLSTQADRNAKHFLDLIFSLSQYEMT